MALLFGPFATAPINTGNWTALPTLPAGVDPMREIVMSSGGTYYVGHCTAGQATDNAGFVFVGGGRVSLGVVDYTKITVRSVSASEAYIFVHTYARMDFGPEGS